MRTTPERMTAESSATTARIGGESGVGHRSGTSARMLVPRPAGESIDKAAVDRGQPVGQAGKSAPAAGVRAADAVILDEDLESIPEIADRHVDPGRLAHGGPHWSAPPRR